MLVGELDGRVTIWQAKYFATGVRRHQLADVRESFESARSTTVGRNLARANQYARVGPATPAPQMSTVRMLASVD